MRLNDYFPLPVPVMERRRPEQYIPTIPDPDGDGARLFSIMGNLKITSGRGAGKRFRDVASPWQERWIRALGAGSSTGLIDETLLLVAKKNGKTVMSGLLMLAWTLCFPEAKGSVILLAAQKDQADLAFDCAASAIEADSALMTLFHIKRYNHQIEHLETGTIIRTSASDAAATTGSMPNFYLIDELHQCGATARGANAIKQLSSGSAMRERAMGVYISTVPLHGELPSGLYASMVNRGRRLLSGEAEADERLLPVIYEHPLSVDHSEKEHWWRSNPNMDVTITREWLEREYHLSKEDPDGSVLGHFLAQHLQIVTAEVVGIERWIPLPVWDKAADPTITLDTLLERTEYQWVAIDAGGRDDPSCLLLLGYEEDTGNYLVWTRQYLHQDGYNLRRKTSPYESFVDSGELEVFKGEGEDMQRMKALIEDIRERGDILAVAYDAYHMKHMAAELKEEGLDVEPIPQGVRLTPHILLAERRIYEGVVKHPGLPMLRWNLNNCTLEETSNGALRLSKSKDVGSRSKKIDGVICLVMVLAIAQEEKPLDVSNWIA